MRLHPRRAARICGGEFSRCFPPQAAPRRGLRSIWTRYGRNYTRPARTGQRLADHLPKLWRCRWPRAGDDSRLVFGILRPGRHRDGDRRQRLMVVGAKLEAGPERYREADAGMEIDDGLLAILLSPHLA